MQKITIKERIQRKWYWIAKLICRTFAMICFSWKCYGLENIPKEGSFLVVCNHQSFLDPIFCGSRMKRHMCFLARDTLFENWFFGPLIRSVFAIPVKREQGDLSAMRKVIEVLKQGDGVCLYPEGTRTEDGKISPFKSGLGLLCRRGNAAIVPAVIDGAFECWPRTQKLFKTGMPIIIHFGKAVSANEAKEMGDEKLADFLTQTLREMQKNSRTEQGKEPFNYE